MRSPIDGRLNEARAIADRLLGSKAYSFSDLKPSDLKDGLAVIYAIFEKDSGEQNPTLGSKST